MLQFGRRIPVTIHPLFWLTAGILGFLWGGSLRMALPIMVLILISILVHEYGHALSAKMFGQNAEISLVALGGMTRHDGKQLKRWQDFVVVLMGPIFGLLLAGAAQLTSMLVGGVAPNAVMYILKLFVIINVFWTIINLLPILPLDGGQLLRIVLEGIWGHRGLKITLAIGVVLAVVIGSAAFVTGQFLIGAILLLLAFEGFSSWRQVRQMTENDQNQEVQKMLDEAQSELQLSRYESAKQKLEALLTKTNKGLIFDAAIEQLAFVYDKEGDLERVYNLLKGNIKNLTLHGRCLLHKATYFQKDYTLTLKIGSQCFQETQAYEIAFTNALASACMNDARAAIGWLECSVKYGLPNLKMAVSKDEFDSIRTDPVFLQFLNFHEIKL